MPAFWRALPNSQYPTAWLSLLTYLGLLQLEHRPSTIPLQHTRFWAASHAPFQLSFWALSSASVSRLQLLQGRPLLRFPWGFQLRACRVMLAGGFLSVWPIQPHFLWRICLASGSCSARSHKSVLPDCLCSGLLCSLSTVQQPAHHFWFVFVCTISPPLPKYDT